jgi:hypothetical protein
VALQQLWPAWQGTFVAAASGEINAPDDITRDLESVKAKVESSLGEHRGRLRREIVDAIKGQTGNPDFVAEERLAVIKDFGAIQGIKSLIDAYSGLVVSHSIERDEALASGLGDLSPGNWAAQISRMRGKKTQVPTGPTDQASSGSSSLLAR